MSLIVYFLVPEAGGSRQQRGVHGPGRPGLAGAVHRGGADTLEGGQVRTQTEVAEGKHEAQGNLK